MSESTRGVSIVSSLALQRRLKLKGRRILFLIAPCLFALKRWVRGKAMPCDAMYAVPRTRFSFQVTQIACGEL
jgi:hypothetical protein